MSSLLPYWKRRPLSATFSSSISRSIHILIPCAPIRASKPSSAALASVSSRQAAGGRRQEQEAGAGGRSRRQEQEAGAGGRSRRQNDEITIQPQNQSSSRKV